MMFGRSLYSLENLLDHILNAFQEKPPDDLGQKKTLTMEILSAWHTLLVLDNLESIQDGRILDFIQQLPVDTKTKVLITSRQKTGAWELPIRVDELSIQEVTDFLQVRVSELQIDCPYDRATAEKVWQVSGGLPLAIQWILGRCKIERDLDKALTAVGKRDSPVLEFSFRNIWTVLSPDAKAILGALTIFYEPPTLQQIAIATAYGIETIDKALGELADVTLVSKYTQNSDGRVLYVALPITLSFARHQLETMGEFEVECRKRYHRYSEQMKLQESEIFRFRNTFERFGLDTDNEKRAAILCQRGFSEMSVGNVDSADMLFQQGLDLAPHSSYVFAMRASYELARNRVGLALEHIEEACKRATRRTGSLCYRIKARILDEQRDRYGRVDALARALEYDPDDPITIHQYGVALSRAGRPDEAIKQFDAIIEREKDKSPPSLQLRMALKTRMINLKRLDRNEEIKKNLKLVDEMLKKYPHLAPEVKEFEEFREQ